MSKTTSKKPSISFEELVRKNTPPPPPPRPSLMDRVAEQVLERYGEEFYLAYLESLIGNAVPATVMVNVIGAMDIEAKPKAASVIKEYRNQLRLAAATKELSS